jgi:prevent-host-death family protein
MVTRTIDIKEAKNQLSELLTLAQQGTEIILADDNTPLARLVPVDKTSSQPRIAGLHQGAIWISDDFDDPLLCR